MVRYLEPAAGAYAVEFLSGAQHRNRGALEDTLRSPSGAEGWRGLLDDYREQAADWAAWVAGQPDYWAPLAAALDLIPRVGLAVEVGAGTGGAGAPDPDADLVVVTDAVSAMLDENAAPRRVVCDVRRLPFVDGSVDLVFGLNAVPEFAEFARVTSTSGYIVLATSFGPDTPLYVSPAEVEKALGTSWSVSAQRVAAGEWVLAQRENNEGRARRSV